VSVALKLTALTKRGWRVFPVNGKRPIIKDWPNEATSNGLKARALFNGNADANIGIACGAESDLVVIDLDGNTGIESWEALTAFEENPLTYQVATGRGGRHIYFRHPGVPIRNSASRIAPSIDVRADGGYVVAAGSIHPDTQLEYLVEVDAPVATMPEWLIKKLEEAPRQTPTSDLDTPREGNTGILASAGPVADLIRGEVEVGRRNVSFHAFFTWTAWNVHLPEALAWEWAQELNEALPVPEDDIETLQATCQSAYSSPPPEREPERRPGRQWPKPEAAPQERSYRETPLKDRLAKRAAEKGRT
jgi:hypothetical protein